MLSTKDRRLGLLKLKTYNISDLPSSLYRQCLFLTFKKSNGSMRQALQNYRQRGEAYVTVATHDSIVYSWSLTTVRHDKKQVCSSFYTRKRYRKKGIGRRVHTKVMRHHINLVKLHGYESCIWAYDPASMALHKGWFDE